MLHLPSIVKSVLAVLAVKAVDPVVFTQLAGQVKHLSPPAPPKQDPLAHTVATVAEVQVFTLAFSHRVHTPEAAKYPSLHVAHFAPSFATQVTQFAAEQVMQSSLVPFSTYPDLQPIVLVVPSAAILHQLVVVEEVAVQAVVQ